MDLAKDLILKHLHASAELKDFELTDESVEYIRTGMITISGRDKKGQPN